MKFPGVLVLGVIYLKFLKGVTQFGEASSREAVICLEFPGIKVKWGRREGQKCFSFLEQPITFLPVHNLTFVFLALAYQWKCDVTTSLPHFD